MSKRPAAACLALTFFYVSVLLAGLFLTVGTPSAAGLKTELLTISGEVTSRKPAKGPVIIEIYDRPQLAPRPAYSKTIPAPGPFEVRVHPGTYYLRAFVDENRNQTWDPGEPAGLYVLPLPAGTIRAAPKETQDAQALIVLPLASQKGINIAIDTLER
jgi:hypothetical protein